MPKIDNTFNCKEENCSEKVTYNYESKAAPGASKGDGETRKIRVPITCLKNHTHTYIVEVPNE